MRKKTRLSLLILGSLLSASPFRGQQASVSANPRPSIQPPAEGHRFANGIQLQYAAEWRLWSAGTATLRLDQIGGEERVTATADSSGVVALLYRVQDRFESYFDAKTFCSSRITKHTEEGLHKRETVIHFDQSRMRAVLDERNLRNNETKHTEVGTPGCVTDVLSGIYYLSGQRLTVGDTYVFPVNDGGQTATVRAYVEGREDVKTDAGTFHTVRVASVSESQAAKGRGKVWIWYTDDPAHTPVQMRSRLFWGTLTLRLTRLEKQP